MNCKHRHLAEGERSPGARRGVRKAHLERGTGSQLPAFCFPGKEHQEKLSAARSQTKAGSFPVCSVIPNNTSNSPLPLLYLEKIDMQNFCPSSSFPRSPINQVIRIELEKDIEKKQVCKVISKILALTASQIKFYKSP